MAGFTTLISIVGTFRNIFPKTDLVSKSLNFLPKIPFLEGEKMTNKLIKPEHQTYPIVAKAKIGPSPNKLFIFL